MNPFVVATIVNATVSLLMSLIVTLSDRKNRVNQIWALTTFLLGTWSLGLSGVLLAKSYDMAMAWQYLLDASAIIIPITFFVFVVYLLKLGKVYGKAINLSWVVAIILFIMSFTKLFKLGVGPKFSFDYWIVPGPLYFVFPLVFSLFVGFSLYLLLRERARTLDPVLKRQIDYVLGAQIFGFGGGITNFLPQIFNIYPIGNYFIVFYVFFISYSIFKYRLFNIKVIATELFSYAIWVFLFARILLATSLNERITDIGLFLIVLIFTFLLIQSVRREVQQKERLEQLSNQLAKANDQLKVLDKARAEFISIASHQLRTPPATIKWYLAAITGGDFGPVPARVAKAVQTAEVTNNSLISLIDDLLNASRIERGKMEFVFEPTDILKITQMTVDQLTPQATQRKQKLIFEKPKDPIPEVNADREKLRQVVNNIIDNAIKYTQVGGTITVKLAKTAKDAIIKIKDNGRGIKPGEEDNIFQKYDRGGKKMDSQGLGLGLYVARVVMEQHQGKIWAKSPGEGKGSTFVISLPLKTNLKNSTLDLVKQQK